MSDSIDIFGIEVGVVDNPRYVPTGPNVQSAYNRAALIAQRTVHADFLRGQTDGWRDGNDTGFRDARDCKGFDPRPSAARLQVAYQHRYGNVSVPSADYVRGWFEQFPEGYKPEYADWSSRVPPCPSSRRAVQAAVRVGDGQSAFFMGQATPVRTNKPVLQVKSATTARSNQPNLHVPGGPSVVASGGSAKDWFNLGVKYGGFDKCGVFGVPPTYEFADASQRAAFYNGWVLGQRMQLC